MNEQIAAIEKSVTKAKLAAKLGCRVDELQITELDCPLDKLSKVIGKEGRNVKKIEESASVALDINRETGKIIITGGNTTSFHMAIQAINRIVTEIEEEIEVSTEFITYMTSKHINALNDLRQGHPDVYFDVIRNRQTVAVRGPPTEVAKLKNDFRNLIISKSERRLTPDEALIVIGKKGATIDRIVSQQQAAIEIQKKDDHSLAIVIGPSDHIETALIEMEDLITTNKEMVVHIAVNQVVKQTLLEGSGIGIKALQKKINEITAEQDVGQVHLSFDTLVGNNGSDIIIRAKNAAIPIATKMVEDTVREIDAAAVRLIVDKHALPQIIGKGGETIRTLIKGKSVNIEVDRDSCEVAISGFDREQVAQVKAEIDTILVQNQVARIPADKDTLEQQFKEFIRSKDNTVIKELVRFDLDTDESVILVRGTQENVQKAVEAYNEYLDSNYLERLEITNDDKDELLAGGGKSQIVTLSRQLEVNLSVDRANPALLIRGPSEKVGAAVSYLKTYLQGGDGTVVSKVPVAAEALGNIIGRGGKTKAALEAKYPDISLYIHRSGTITLRGPKTNVDNCRAEILKLVATARIQQSISVTEEQKADIEKTNLVRRISQLVPVNIVTEAAAVKIRGIPSDVQYAVSLINEHLTGVYESRIALGSSQFTNVMAACRDSVHFERIKEATGGEVSLDDATNSIVVRGKRSNVKKAKFSVMELLEFLLPNAFRRERISKAMHSIVGQSSVLTDIAATTGTNCSMDRDTSTILILSTDKDQANEAVRLLQAKINEAERLVCVFEFDTAEAWLIPFIIGKNGSLVNSLRKESGCTIDINKEERTVVVSGTDEGAVAKTKADIHNLVEKAKKENAFVDVPDQAISRFVGKAGSRIIEFSQKYGVEVQSLRRGPPKIKIQGDEAKVQVAKAAVLEWLTEWEKTAEPERISIARHQIAPIMGAKGSNIQAMEEEYGCKIHLDRDRLVISLHGGTYDKRRLAVSKIEEIKSANPAPAAEENGGGGDNGKTTQNSEMAENNGHSKKDKPNKSEGGTDLEERIDRASEFPALPVGVLPSDNNGASKRRRNKKKKASGPNGGATVGVGA